MIDRRPVVRAWSQAFAMSLLLSAVPCAGCGKGKVHEPVYPVHGQVLFEGRPVAWAFVVLHPVNSAGETPVHPHAYGTTDGTFELTSFTSGDGAPAGEYAVTVQLRQPPLKDDDPPARNLLPSRYASPDTSGLRVQIVEGSNELEPLRLKR